MHEFEKAKYTPKQRLREQVKYSTNIARGAGAFYLPDRRYSSGGDGLGEERREGAPAPSSPSLRSLLSVPAGDGVGDILGFINNNKELIANVAGAVGAVADTAGKVASTGVDIVRKIRELKGNGITDAALEEVLAAAAPKIKRTTESKGFYYIKP